VPLVNTKINPIKSVVKTIALPVIPSTMLKQLVPNAPLANTKIKQMEKKIVKNVQLGNGAMSLVALLNAPITVLRADGQTQQGCLPIRNVKNAVQESGVLPLASFRTINVQMNAARESGVMPPVLHRTRLAMVLAVLVNGRTKKV
jgi:hypothetical protein